MVVDGRSPDDLKTGRVTAGLAERGDQNVGAEPDPRGHPGRHRERGQRFQPVTVGTGGLPAALPPADLRPAVLVETLAEDDMVGDDQTIEPRLVEQARGAEHGVPAARVGGRERHERRRQLGVAVANAENPANLCLIWGYSKTRSTISACSVWPARKYRVEVSRDE
ncbi:hypothetical protein [Actinoallomurus liliacearum]|uniref:hypothetical protein n=1 Tax=Actinoallomurus liliacearum TaxID=1080073 RepID=UPI0031F1AC97